MLLDARASYRIPAPEAGMGPVAAVFLAGQIEGVRNREFVTRENS